MKMSEKKIIYEKTGKVGTINPNFIVEDTLKPGMYIIKSINSMFGTISEIYTDEYICLPNNAEDMYPEHMDLDYINKYFSEESINIHRKLNVPHKLEIIFYGKQGTGKTTICYAYAKHVTSTQNVVAFTVNNLHELEFAIRFCKDADPKGEMKKIFIYDECEDDMDTYEAQFKKTLDSTSSINNALFLFTTNHLDQIPDTIKDRPSRIKWCIEVKGYTDEIKIFELISNLNKDLDSDIRLSKDDINGLVKTMMGKTIDEIKNQFIDSVLHINLRKKVKINNKLADEILKSIEEES